MFEPGVWGTMLEPRVLVLLPFEGVRTLGSETLCSNPGFGELYVGTPGSGTPSPPQGVRTLGSGTPHVPSNFNSYNSC